jgi:hypothetical protein
MLVHLRRRYARLITTGAQAALLLVALQNPGRGLTAGALALLAAVSLAAWLSAQRRARAIGDTPTAKIASAAQGYAEFVGAGRALGGIPVVSPATGLPCLWYRYLVERRAGDEWVRDEHGESDASFVLDDGSGQCLVDPEGAEMLVTRRERWSRGDRRYTQWSLLEHGRIYALGEFRTRGGLDLRLDAAADVRALIEEWKRDRAALTKRFDLDGNGEIDLGEWELARSQAQREVALQHREARLQPELHLLQQPADGRLYLISDLDPARLARRYRLWSLAHFSLFVAGLAGAAWALRAGTGP